MRERDLTDPDETPETSEASRPPRVDDVEPANDGIDAAADRLDEDAS